MLQGLSHITVQVSDLDKSLLFYVELLGMTLRAKWRRGAYLSLGQLWFCLSCGESRPGNDYSHIAFSATAENFPVVKARLLALGGKQWQQNSSEGESLYILDPDGHKLEIHVGNLDSRLAAIAAQPYDQR